MPREVRSYVVTIPKTTPATTPYKHQLTQTPQVVRTIRVRVPPGPRGTMGFAIGNAGKNVVPLGTDEWIIQTDWSTEFVTTDYTTSGTWWVIGYNTDPVNDHSVYVIFSSTPATVTTTTTPLPTGTISSVGYTGSGGVPVTSTLQLTGVTAAKAPTPVTVPTLPAAPTIPPVTLPAATLGTAPTFATPTLPPPPSL